MAHLASDGTSLTYCMEEYLGSGTTGLVIQRGEHALKVAKLTDTSKFSAQGRGDSEYVNQVNRVLLEREKYVYHRLGHAEGIVKVIDISEQGILLECLKKGDIAAYMDNNAELSIPEKTKWIMTIIKAICHIHRSNVLIDDIALRNFLIADDFSVKTIDFGQSTVFPLNIDITTANANGLTILVDLFHLGCIIYSIVAWIVYECNLFEHELQRPALKDLPDLDGLLFQQAIKKCWTAEYRSADDLYIEVLNLWERFPMKHR
ncbi:hypothetical protein K402DRAFT_398609 [Aulographum hederae CBS 113979]|uniref:Protein kinase domain-containing protein n=1 Tax=Aulographum hederae CBS 113979 TaxID=1176131 RepID=A0A6G1GKG0_9PEZI|nr:hypothetical protein K402DRAFT_398609 [Aulographum hederae CBS 113979]